MIKARHDKGDEIMNWKKKGIALLLVTALLCGSAAAHYHGEFRAAPLLSGWAKDAVAKAREYGFVQDYLLPQDATQPMLRKDFADMAMDFVAFQIHSDRLNLDGMIEYHLKPASAKSIFIDDGGAYTLAYYLGLVQGTGGAHFSPEGKITRQEAAVMLVRAYAVYAGALPEAELPPNTFSDQAEIADWAKQSVALLSSWGVMQGDEDGRFAPQEYYSVEQCVVTLLRLYENAPISRKEDNTVPPFTYEKAMKYVQDRDPMAYTETVNIKGSDATFIRIDIHGTLHPASLLYFIYPDGGVQWADLGVCTEQGHITPAQPLENPRFSKDGKTFHCSVELQSDTLLYTDTGKEFVAHKAGTYHITVNMETGVCRNQFIPSTRDGD